MTSCGSTRSVGRVIVAGLMDVYGVAGILIGILAFLIHPLGGVFLVGPICVCVGTARLSRPGLHPTVLLVVGGTLCGGLLGLFATAWEYTGAVNLSIGFLVGAALLGWPPIVVGLGRLLQRPQAHGADA